MRYEIINPSDKCFVSGDNFEAVCAAVALLGEGRYALESEDTKTTMPFFMFGGLDEWWVEKFGRKFQAYFDSAKSDIATVLDTFKYNGERSSMNNIGAYAERLAKRLRTIQEGLSDAAEGGK